MSLTECNFIEIDKIYKDIVLYDYTDCDIQTLEHCDIQYNTFFEEFILRNKPCIIKNVSSTWECTKKWIENDDINYKYLIDNYGDLEAPVADCNNITYNAQCKNDMSVRDYMYYLQNKKKESLLYLKDWHLRRVRPYDTFYEVPSIFASDWLNEFAQDHQEDDFMFVYIGPKDSWTPLHADVYYSYSWSVNVVGRKKWILFPPSEEDKLKDSLGNLPLLFDPEKFVNIKYYEIIQEKGDAIFVPSGWHHQVVNILNTVSINHNWINGCNIEAVWTALQKCLVSVEHEIEEFKETSEFPSQCQLLLKSLFGMDFVSFVTFLCYIAKKRLYQLKEGNPLTFNKYSVGKNHIIFDITIILKVLNLLQNHPLLLNKNISIDIKHDITNVQNSISEILKLYL